MRFRARNPFWVAILGVCLVLLIPQRLNAQPAQVLVEKGISEFQDLEFAAAVATLEELVKRGDASQSQTLVALELIAISQLSLGKVAESRRAFLRLLKINPDYLLRNHEGSPKVESLFQSVRAELLKGKDPDAGEGKPVLAATELSEGKRGTARAGRRFEMKILSSGSAAKELILYWRSEESGPFHPVPMRASKSQWRAKFELPPRPTDYALQYYVVARGLAGQTLATLGSERVPLRLRVSGRETSGGGANAASWYTRWPLWAGVGAAIVGGSILVLRSGSDPQQGALSPGRITLTP